MRLQDSNGSRQLWRQLCCHSILINYFRSLDLSLLHACFWGVLYATLSRKMEIISRVEPFDRIITFLEFIGLHGFGCWLHVAILCFFIFLHFIALHKHKKLYKHTNVLKTILLSLPRVNVNVMLIHRVWHLCNLPCAYTLFLLVSIVRYEF